MTETKITFSDGTSQSNDVSVFGFNDTQNWTFDSEHNPNNITDVYLGSSVSAIASGGSSSISSITIDPNGVELVWNENTSPLTNASITNLVIPKRVTFKVAAGYTPFVGYNNCTCIYFEDRTKGQVEAFDYAKTDSSFKTIYPSWWGIDTSVFKYGLAPIEMLTAELSTTIYNSDTIDAIFVTQDTVSELKTTLDALSSNNSSQLETKLNLITGVNTLATDGSITNLDIINKINELIGLLSGNTSSESSTIISFPRNFKFTNKEDSSIWYAFTLDIPNIEEHLAAANQNEWPESLTSEQFTVTKINCSDNWEDTYGDTSAINSGDIMVLPSDSRHPEGYISFFSGMHTGNQFIVDMSTGEITQPSIEEVTLSYL